jgi:hypothetical protein
MVGLAARRPVEPISGPPGGQPAQEAGRHDAYETVSLHPQFLSEAFVSVPALASLKLSRSE